MSNDNQEAKQELVFVSTAIVAYDPFRAQLADLKAGNAKAVFDYRDAKGNKEARSHIYKLRQTKSAIEKVRVAEKESVLLKGRQIDSEAKEITKIVEEMISVHELPILEIEAEEAARVEKHQRAIQAIIDIGNGFIGGEPQPFGLLFSELELIKVDESFQEFEVQAHREKEAAKAKLDHAFSEHKKREEEQAELARLREEAAQREQKEREERIAREAAENARIAAEKAAAEERQRLADEQLRKDREAQAAIDKAEREKLEAENARLRQQQEADQAASKAKQDAIDAAARAEREKQAAIEAERKRQADAVEAERLATEQREKNKAHAKKINNELLADIMAIEGANITEEQGKLIIAALARKQLRHASVKY